MPNINYTGRDPMTGHLKPGAKLPGGGNPLAKAHYRYRKAFIDAATPEEWDQARAKLVEDVLSDNPKIRAAARPLYYELMCGKTVTIDAHIGRSDDDSSKDAAEATLDRVLKALEKHPAAKSDVASALLDMMPAIEVTSIEAGTNGSGD